MFLLFLCRFLSVVRPKVTFSSAVADVAWCCLPCSSRRRTLFVYKHTTVERIIVTVCLYLCSMNTEDDDCVADCVNMLVGL